MITVIENEEFTIKKSFRIYIANDNGTLSIPTESYRAYESGEYPNAFEDFDSEEEALEAALKSDVVSYSNFVILPVYYKNMVF